MVDFAYRAELRLNDGSIITVDLEERGWAKPDLLTKIRAFTLVPKDPNTRWPLVRVHIPEHAKPVWLWRTYRESSVGDGATVREMRIYGIGFKRRGHPPYYVWVVPGGHIESGTYDSTFANTIWSGK